MSDIAEIVGYSL